MLFFKLSSEVADYNIFPELLDISFSFSFKEKRNCQQEIIIVRRFFQGIPIQIGLRSLLLF